MWTFLIPASFLFLALLHLTPALAIVRPALVTKLYGAAPGDVSFPLLQHRAALFAAVLALCIWAAFDPAARPPATVVTAISMLSFLWIYAATGRPEKLKSIALADVAGLPALAVATYASFGLPG